MIRCFESDGFKNEEELFNETRQDATEVGVEVWAILNDYKVAHIEDQFGGMRGCFTYLHELGTDWRRDLLPVEMASSFITAPNAWFLILHRCVRNGVRHRLVEEFRKACKELLAANLVPDLRLVMDAYAEAYARELDFDEVRVTDLQHRQAAMLVGAATDLLRTIMANYRKEVNELQKWLCQGHELASN